MNSIGFLCYLLLLAHLQHRASAGYGLEKELGKIAIKGDSSEPRHVHLIDKSFDSKESSSQLEGIIPKLRRAIKNPMAYNTRKLELLEPLLDKELEASLETRYWLAVIYNPIHTRSFLTGTFGDVCDIQKRPDRARSDYISDKLSDVVWQMFRLRGKDDDELGKIATCAKAIAQVIHAKEHDANLISKLERTSREYVRELWKSGVYYKDPQNDVVHGLLKVLLTLCFQV
ncbi:hypothetical protein PtA15_2A859 [Puccinia triticina]|uniref:Uncharacterized protein n=1 Tax=Puccinia triticina TaxID=208348 RepID=A0ABY7CIB7_9BASI|nr:uncharacterized protein PtA15_2A859 [Puccinia triticina]WAQ82542.1 hypothetical protein PtA15_2A859 [Puccinia triticina]